VGLREHVACSFAGCQKARCSNELIGARVQSSLFLLLFLNVREGSDDALVDWRSEKRKSDWIETASMILLG
jgi:hypothetical protein